MKKSILGLVALVSCMAAGAQTTWNVDKVHSNVKFAVSHMVVSEVEGSFKMFDGNLVASKADLSDAKVNFSVDVASVNTDNDRRDGHLKSDDFFAAETYPTMSFASTAFTPKGNGTFTLTGNLTIRDVTKSVTLDVEYGGTMVDFYGNTKAGFEITGVINRKEFGLAWDAVTEAGGIVVSDAVKLLMNLQLQRQ